MENKTKAGREKAAKPTQSTKCQICHCVSGKFVKLWLLQSFLSAASSRLTLSKAKDEHSIDGNTCLLLLRCSLDKFKIIDWVFAATFKCYCVGCAKCNRASGALLDDKVIKIITTTHGCRWIMWDALEMPRVKLKKYSVLVAWKGTRVSCARTMSLVDHKCDCLRDSEFCTLIWVQYCPLMFRVS